MTVKRRSKVPAAVSAALALLFVPANVFAYDGIVFSDWDGNDTRAEFIRYASNAGARRSEIQEALGNVRILSFSMIGPDDVDEEDMMVIGDVEAYILRQFNFGHGDCFATSVRRGRTDAGSDRWAVFSQYHGTQGWLHYLYYYEINSRAGF